MRSIVDLPLTIVATRCKTCNAVDSEWCLLQLLADGQWRILTVACTLREQGIDEQDLDRVFFVHACLVAVLQSMTSISEVMALEKHLSLRYSGLR